MAAPEQIWNENDLPSGDQHSITYPSDEDTITYDRSKSGGTAQQGLLAKPETEDGKWSLVELNEKPAGVIKGSGGKGRVSVLVNGYNIKVPRGDTTADTAVTVVSGQSLVDDDGLTIANNLETGQDSAKLTVTPGGTPTLDDSSTPATITISGTNVDGGNIEEVLTFSDGVKAVAQTTTAAFQTVTAVMVDGWKTGTVNIATEAIETVGLNQQVVGDTKMIDGVAQKGYAKSGVTGGIGRITRVTPMHIYFNLP